MWWWGRNSDSAKRVLDRVLVHEVSTRLDLEPGVFKPEPYWLVCWTITGCEIIILAICEVFVNNTLIQFVIKQVIQYNGWQISWKEQVSNGWTKYCSSSMIGDSFRPVFEQACFIDLIGIHFHLPFLSIEHFREPLCFIGRLNEHTWIPKFYKWILVPSLCLTSSTACSCLKLSSWGCLWRRRNLGILSNTVSEEQWKYSWFQGATLSQRV